MVTPDNQLALFRYMDELQRGSKVSFKITPFLLTIFASTWHSYATQQLYTNAQVFNKVR